MMLLWSILNSFKIYLFGKAFLLIDFLAISKWVNKISRRFVLSYFLIIPGLLLFAKVDIQFAIRMFLIFLVLDYLDSIKNPQKLFSVTFVVMLLVTLGLLSSFSIVSYTYYSTPKSLFTVLPFLILGTNLRLRHLIFFGLCIVGILLYETRSLFLGCLILLYYYLKELNHFKKILLIIFLILIALIFWPDFSTKFIYKHEKSNGIRLLAVTTYIETLKSFGNLIFGVGYEKWLSSIQQFVPQGLLDKDLAKNLNPHNFVLDVLIRYGLSGILVLIYSVRNRIKYLKPFQVAGLASLLLTTVTGYERFLFSLFLINVSARDVR